MREPFYLSNKMGGEPYVELVGEAVSWITTSGHYDRAWDKAFGKNKESRVATKEIIQNNRDNAGVQQNGNYYSNDNGAQENNVPQAQSYVSARGPPASSAANGGGQRRRQRNRLPSPEGDADNYYRDNGQRNRRRDSSLDRESEYSERVVRSYEAERDDPRRKPESVLSKKDLRQLRRDSRMSYANGRDGYGSNLGAQQQNQRPRSANPPKSRYYDDDEYGSDYDERTGKRYNTTGRGYDDGYDNDGRGYDREIIETERYRGVSDAHLALFYTEY